MNLLIQIKSKQLELSWQTIASQLTLPMSHETVVGRVLGTRQYTETATHSSHLHIHFRAVG